MNDNAPFRPHPLTSWKAGGPFGISEATVTLENGDKEVINLDRELSIPDDPAKLWKALQRGSGRIVYWRHLVARARILVRAQSQRVEEAEGNGHITARSNLARRAVAEADDTLDPRHFGVVTSVVPLLPEVKKARCVLRQRQFRLEIMEGIAKAYEDRLWTIRQRLGAVQREPHD